MRKLLNSINGKIASAMAFGSVAMMGVCHAEETSLATTVSTAIGTIKDDALSTLSAVAPFAISIAGAYLVWRLGMRFFKGIAK